MSSKRIGRREALGVMGAASAALAFGCGGSPTEPDSGTSTTTSPGSTNSGVRGDSERDGRAVSSLTDFFRSDIREGKTGTSSR